MSTQNGYHRRAFICPRVACVSELLSGAALWFTASAVRGATLLPAMQEAHSRGTL